MRLDSYLVEQKLAPSRHRAQDLIRRGFVKVQGEVVTKCGYALKGDAVVSLVEAAPLQFVSRGGEKLQYALTAYGVQVAGKTCLDCGISTGGFTDCLLQAGAVKVYGVEVGEGQLHSSLQNDKRIILREHTNIRTATKEDVYGEEPSASLAVVDLSFISLKKVVAPITRLLIQPAEVIALIKPQFEVGKALLGKKGIVRKEVSLDPLFNDLQLLVTSLGFTSEGVLSSPIEGGSGNKEYLLYFHKLRR